MNILVLFIGLILGAIISWLIELVSGRISKNKRKAMKVKAIFICILAFEALHMRHGFTALLAKGIVMSSILIIISFIDLRYRIIPDFLVIINLAAGIVFSLILRTPIQQTLIGMLLGGGIMFLLALIPHSLGGGDIKLMFSIGAFLGYNRILSALAIAFILSSVISLVLILFKKKKTKDYIPFAPFLAIGSFISLLI